MIPIRGTRAAGCASTRSGAATSAGMKAARAASRASPMTPTSSESGRQRSANRRRRTAGAPRSKASGTGCACRWPDEMRPPRPPSCQISGRRPLRALAQVLATVIQLPRAAGRHPRCMAMARGVRHIERPGVTSSSTLTRDDPRAAKPLAALRMAALALGLLGAAAAQAATYTARVTEITDGDTLRALHDGREIVVRLRWIDAPEQGQPFSAEARQALGALVAGQLVIVRDYGPDRNGHRLADVVLPDGRNVNRELVRLGWAWWFRKRAQDVGLGTLEADARAAGRGLWADAHPIPPWQWRSSHASRP